MFFSRWFCRVHAQGDDSMRPREYLEGIERFFSTWGKLSMDNPALPSLARHYFRFCRRCSDIVLEVREEGGKGKDVHLGSFGMLHPDVLKAYELRDPSSAVEMDLEPLM